MTAPAEEPTPLGSRGRPARSPFRGPLKWALLECAHYGLMPPRAVSGTALFCDVCRESRRMVRAEVVS